MKVLEELAKWRQMDARRSSRAGYEWARARFFVAASDLTGNFTHVLEEAEYLKHFGTVRLNPPRVTQLYSHFNIKLEQGGGKAQRKIKKLKGSV